MPTNNSKLFDMLMQHYGDIAEPFIFKPQSKNAVIPQTNKVVDNENSLCKFLKKYLQNQHPDADS